MVEDVQKDWKAFKVQPEHQRLQVAFRCVQASQWLDQSRWAEPSQELSSGLTSADFPQRPTQENVKDLILEFPVC